MKSPAAPNHRVTVTPYVSVVIPVYNNPAGIAVALGALALQTYPTTHFETIVVDNNSTDDTPDVVKRFQDENPDRVRLLIEDQIQSSYAARNRGIQQAQGDVLAFTDADCRPAPDWLENGLRALLEGDPAVVAGRVDMTFREEGKPNLFECLDAMQHLDQQRYVERDGYGATANLFVWRQLFVTYGLFLGELRSGGDYELGRRLARAGEALAFCQDAVVYHPARATWAALLAKYRRTNLGARQLAHLGLLDYPIVGLGSFLPWRRYRPLPGIRLNFWQRAAVGSLAILSRYYRLGDNLAHIVAGGR
jgi:glycosyltransferase involved in cell wall biosynthesis